MREDFLVFGAPLISEDEIAEVVATLRSGWIGTGPRVKQFEQRFEEYVGVRHAVAVSSCTAALHLALHVLDIGPGDEVITTPYTWCATSNVIVHRGARPVFVDVDRATGNMDPARIEAAITERTRAILPVHLGGRACDMDAIMEIAHRRGLKVIEDAAHALEATWKGRRAGSIGNCGAFSFYVTKNVTTAEGGMAVTVDAAMADRLRILSLNGTVADAWKRFQADGPSHVQVVEAGYKYNMTDIQAALGLKQLEKVERNLESRERLWRFYDEALADLPLIRPAPVEAGCRHARHLYSLLVDTERTTLTRDALREELKKQRIGTGVHYIALHLHPFYQQQYGYRAGQFPNAEYLSERTFSVPLSPRVTEADARDVVQALRDILR
jgi:dTDP-4-amino-4,6-dideoxygalactose transaminase